MKLIARKSPDAQVTAANDRSQRDDTTNSPAGIVSLGAVESLTLGGGKTFEDNGAAYQRG